jgi:hypothetical protein
MAILIGGLIAGILDLSSAIIITLYYHGNVTRMLQGIASGALGKAAFEGGPGTAALGVGFHFLIAFTATTVFYLASRKIGFLTEQAVVAGVLYGIAVYLFMYLGVQPLAGLHPKFGLLTTSRAVLVHIFCVGLPIALSIKRFSAPVR